MQPGNPGEGGNTTRPDIPGKEENGNGSYIKNGWIYVQDPFSSEKKRDDNGEWYYCHKISDGNLGMLVRGWHEDGQDGQKYYLDPKTGIMLSGGDSYYFTTAAESQQPT